MCKFGKFFKKVIRIGMVGYAALFAVFYFDLDGKLLYYVVERFLCRHYDKMQREDVTKRAYKID